MALYEFRCRVCDDVFSVRRPMSRSADPAVCPDGHVDTVRLLSVFARTGGATPVVSVGHAPETGGCCGGGCGCAR